MKEERSGEQEGGKSGEVVEWQEKGKTRKVSRKYRERRDDRRKEEEGGKKASNQRRLEGKR